MGQKRTCLDCGFLTIQGRELTRVDRIMLGTRGQSASMPSNPEQTRCFKDLWVYGLIYQGGTFDGVVKEIEQDRNQCPGFISYVHGLTPEQHLKRQDEQRKEDRQRKIAQYGIWAALIGIAGTIISLVTECAS